MSIRLAAGIAIAAFALDRASKWWVLGPLDLASQGRLEIAPPYLNFVMAWNKGINFGLFSSDSILFRIVLAVLALAVTVAVMIWAARRGERLFSFGAGLLAGGALGNAYDRLTYGAVADFLNMSCCGIRNPFAFNIADVAIFTGAAVLVLCGAERQGTPAGGKGEPK